MGPARRYAAILPPGSGVMRLSIETVLAYVLIVLLLYTLARLFVGPLRLILSFLLYCFLGAALLYFANMAGKAFFGVTVAVNPYNVLVAGFLNLPGVVMLFFLRHYLRL